MELLPEEIIRLVWQFEGRYTKAMKDTHAFIVSPTFRQIIMPYMYLYYETKVMESWREWIYEHKSCDIVFAYQKEMDVRVQKYLRRMDPLTGHIKGKTDKYKKPFIKRLKFADCLGDYLILCTENNHRCREIMHEGMLFRSVERFPTIRACYDHRRDFIHVKEKCGIEVLDQKWLRNARRRKEAQAYIRHHMSI